MNPRAATLDDKYTLTEGRVFITGTQALVRLPLMQRAADRAAGLDTRGFVSGYRGSPLGNLDQALWAAKARLDEAGIVFRPGVNEELAATACWGTQQVGLFEGARHDGVFALWYGKGPGVDRAGDALKHGNLSGTARHGGVLVLAGDDHAAKSSTTAHQSEPALAAALMPILHPANVQDYLDLGLHGFALSRHAGLWVGFKCLTETVESGATVRVSPDRVRPVVPAGEGAPIHAGLTPVLDERSTVTLRLPAAQAYVRANGLDRVTHDADRRTLGIVTAGKPWLDLRQAFLLLGLDEARLAALGVRVLKLALTWPVEPETLAAFAAGHAEVLVVEEKRGFVEDQVARLLFRLDAARRPELSGKTTPRGAALLRGDYELSPPEIAASVVARLEALGLADADLHGRLDELLARRTPPAAGLTRLPGFCSGCPHNTSTKVPEGSLALGGIGCHTMAAMMPDRPTAAPAQMGGEGANWIGMAPFTDRPHVFQNLGDGTYFHSGLIAIRAAVAAGVNITYKLLVNDAVAMTGGQPIDGALGFADIVAQLRAERVDPIAVVSDDPDQSALDAVRDLVPVHPRAALDAVQRDLRGRAGVSALVYVQTCAAEKRRRRKRGVAAEPERRYFIDPDVCEGCGDCSVQSNCVSLVPVETAFGRKRAIDQSGCNKDYSCVAGFCPSFVTVDGAAPRRSKASPPPSDALPAPVPPPIVGSYDVLLVGVGGTGVVTVGAVLAMAAFLDGLACSTLDLTGLSQKNGAVSSHLRLSRGETDLAARIPPGEAAVLLGCDLIVAASSETLAACRPDRTRAIVNAGVAPTLDFQRDPDLPLGPAPYRRAIEASAEARFVEASGIAARLLGDSIAANMVLVGYAFQRGALPIGEAAIRRAIALNGVAVGANLAAFDWGRAAAHDPSSVAASAPEPAPETLAALVAHRSAHLIRYQGKRYAATYQAFVERVAAAEAAALPGHDDLAKAVARGLAKLMAYKDEYEVARLHASPEAKARLAEAFEGPARIGYNLAPPLLARRDRLTGVPLKRAFGPWMRPVFGVLSRLKGLRGTPVDPFGQTAERRMERHLIGEYRAMIEALLPTLHPGTHAATVDRAALAERIRGFGHVKARNAAEVRERWARPVAAETPERRAMAETS